MIVRDGKSKAFQRSLLESQMNFRLDRYDMGDTGMEYYFRGYNNYIRLINYNYNESMNLSLAPLYIANTSWLEKQKIFSRQNRHSVFIKIEILFTICNFFFYY